MFICMPKLNFNIHFLLKILHFQESCNLPHNLRTRILPDMGLVVKYQITIVFILNYLQEKLMKKFFKNYKKPYFGAILGPFLPK